jgi:hypothetical protein
MVGRRNGIITMRRHGGAWTASAKPQHLLLGAALAALLLGLEKESEGTHRNAHVMVHPAMFMSEPAKRCAAEKSEAQSTQSCKNTKADIGVRPRSN